MIFYAGWGQDQIEVAVDDPGDGYIYMRTFGGRGAATQVAGARLGELLDDLTTAVLEGQDGAFVRGLGAITGAQCRALLPALQKAVLAAAAGTDRYERVHLDPASGDLGPLCARCGQGSEFSGGVTISELCIEFGHVPFGQPGTKWENAQ